MRKYYWWLDEETRHSNSHLIVDVKLGESTSLDSCGGFLWCKYCRTLNSLAKCDILTRQRCGCVAIWQQPRGLPPDTEIRPIFFFRRSTQPSSCSRNRFLPSVKDVHVYDRIQAGLDVKHSTHCEIQWSNFFQTECNSPNASTNSILIESSQYIEITSFFSNVAEYNMFIFNHRSSVKTFRLQAISC